jgi:hypothetical protein
MSPKAFILPAASGFRLEPSFCRPLVENLCMIGEKAVQKLTAQIFLVENLPAIASGGHVDGVFAPRFA